MKYKFDDRRSFIINELESNNEVDTMSLSRRLNVSEITIRRDFQKLEAEGILKRTYKGAMSIRETHVDDSLQTRLSENGECKEIICKYAAGIIHDNDIVMIDASTTAFGLCKYIKDKKITVVTNSINVASAFLGSNSVNLIMVGGIMRKSSASFVGEDTVESLKKLNIQKVFISAKAFSYEAGLTDINLFEIETKKAAISKSKDVCVLIDNHKLNKVSLQKICDISSIQRLFIDGLRPFTKEEEKTLQDLRDYGIDVIICK